jgi:hypothetical protein
MTSGDECEYDNSSFCEKSHTLQPSDLVLNIWPELQGFHWTASLLSEVSEWDVAEGGGSSSLVSSPRWHRAIILWWTDISRCLETEAFCKREVSYSQIRNNCYRRLDYFDSLISVTEQYNLPCSARAWLNYKVPVRTKQCHRRTKNRFYANGRCAHVPVGTAHVLPPGRIGRYSYVDDNSCLICE